MNKLPKPLPYDLHQTQWAAIIDPVISNPTNNSNLLKNISLVTGVNTINHKLGRKLQGWTLTRKRAAAEIYDSQDSNQMPELTLVLVSDADVSIDLMVF